MVPYNEALELFENIKDVNVENLSESASLIIFKIVDNYGASNVLILENLTGLTFSSKENLYDYFRKTLKITEKDIQSFAASQLMDLLSNTAESGLTDELKNLFS